LSAITIQSRAPFAALSQRNASTTCGGRFDLLELFFEARRVQVRAMLGGAARPPRCLHITRLMATSIIALTNTVGFAASIRRML